MVLAIFIIRNGGSKPYFSWMEAAQLVYVVVNILVNGHGGGTTVSVLGGNNFRVIMADSISWYLVSITTVIIGRMFHPDKCSDNWVYFVGKPILNFTSERKLHL